MTSLADSWAALPGAGAVAADTAALAAAPRTSEPFPRDLVAHALTGFARDERETGRAPGGVHVIPEIAAAYDADPAGALLAAMPPGTREAAIQQQETRGTVDAIADYLARRDREYETLQEDPLVRFVTRVRAIVDGHKPQSARATNALLYGTAPVALDPARLGGGGGGTRAPGGWAEALGGAAGSALRSETADAELARATVANMDLIGTRGRFVVPLDIENATSYALALLQRTFPDKFTGARRDQFLHNEDALGAFVRLVGNCVAYETANNFPSSYYTKDRRASIVASVDNSLRVLSDAYIRGRDGNYRAMSPAELEAERWQRDHAARWRRR